MSNPPCVRGMLHWPVGPPTHAVRVGGWVSSRRSDRQEDGCVMLCRSMASIKRVRCSNCGKVQYGRVGRTHDTRINGKMSYCGTWRAIR